MEQVVYVYVQSEQKLIVFLMNAVCDLHRKIGKEDMEFVVLYGADC